MSARYRPRQVEIGGSNLTHSDQPSQDRMELDDAEGGDEMMRASFGEEGVNLRGTQLSAVVLGEGAGIVKAIRHPGLSQRSSRSAWISCAMVAGDLPSA